MDSYSQDPERAAVETLDRLHTVEPAEAAVPPADEEDVEDSWTGRLSLGGG